MTKYVEVTKIMECTPDENNIEIGKTYEVVAAGVGGIFIYVSRAHQKYFIFNDQFQYVEQFKEED